MRGRLERVLGALEREGVRYLVVGGVAVVLHGYLRTTADLDLVVGLEAENVRRAVGVFRELGFEPRVPVALEAFADPAERRRWVVEKSATVFTLWHPGEPGFVVDLFVEEPFEFESRYRRAATARLGEASVRVLSVDDLVEMKRATGRPQDLRDAEALIALRDAKEDDAR